ncbi:LuxR C-terminal-related transcriptional regulator [Pedobacter aquatilis]|uniref:LuxR C-terminal-related transcriptional regulator n=1 Tax=Pedobacter aquatilis TaxID=351343 RepID=UPI0029311B9A|nr:LuxR C-terminal-related transcriptional regulator [Pedobacter aquatilis]
MTKKIAVLLYILSIQFVVTAKAQQLVIDSLKAVLAKTEKADKPIVMAELARASYETDVKKAISLAMNATNLAKMEKDKGVISFCYATTGHLLARKGQEKQASLYIDSAVTYSQKSTNRIYSGFAWFRKGWFELTNGDNEKAMAAFIKSDKLLKEIQNPKAFSYRTLINHYAASIYAYGSDTLKQHKYALAALQMARKSKYPDDIQLAYMTLAHSFFSAFEANVSRRNLLDSAIYYYRKAGNTYRLNQGKILLQSNASVTALNMANIYFKYFPPQFQDSAKRYVNDALTIARKTNTPEVIANCYGILSEYAMRNGQYQHAENYLLTGIAELNRSIPGVDITRSRMMMGLANLAEQSGDKTRALNYYKQYIEYYKKVFDAQKLTAVQQLEEQYQAEQRNLEIARLRERANLNRQINWLYVAIGSASILVLALLLGFYHYKLKASQQRMLISLQEKQEAELLASLGEQERERIAAQQALLQDRTEWLERELLAGTLKIEEKNTILELLKEKSKSSADVAARSIGRIITQNLRMDRESADQHNAIGDIHPGFFSALQERAGEVLTKLDLKYCSYILMGLDNKEIANRLGVEPKSIRMARYRLKQKLGLKKQDNLDLVVRSYDKRYQEPE